MSVSKRLYLLIFAAMLGLLTVTGLGLYEMRQVYQAANFGNVNSVPAMSILQQMSDRFGDIRSLSWQYATVTDSGRQADIERRIQQQQQAIEKTFADYEVTIADARDRALFNDVRSSVSRVVNAKEKIVRQVKDGQAQAALLEMNNEHGAQVDAARTAIDRLLAYNHQLSEGGAREAQNIQQSAVLVTSLIAVVVALLLLLLGATIIRGLMRTLGGEPVYAAACVNRIAAGDLAVDITLNSTRNDSLLASMSAMQEVLRRFLKDMQHMSTEHDKGDIDVLMDAASFQGEFRTMAEGVNNMVQGHIQVKKKAMACLKEFGEGHFDAHLENFPGKKAFINETMEQVRANLKALIEDAEFLVQAAMDGRVETRADSARHQGGFRRIVDGMNQTLEVMVAPILVVKEATDAINVAAREIAAGNQNLSQRTETQAASLEETASSMEELTSTVRQNAENARQANQLARGASDIAVRGGVVVSEVVTTMQEINTSAKKIVDIISVIDGIAFQTNILALNAAVEAARAGEQGRGFAVVASEVRNLAQRSASAAKDIKSLIGDSVEKVEGGAKLVNDAGHTMQEIVSAVKRVTDIMAEISAASLEQSAGIEQVNTTITQMDDVTQQNAALVEEAAAAAESLEEQAQALADAAAVFKIGSDGNRGKPRRARLPQPAVAAPVAAKHVSKPSKPLPPPRADDDEWEEF